MAKVSCYETIEKKRGELTVRVGDAALQLSQQNKLL